MKFITHLKRLPTPVGPSETGSASTTSVCHFGSGVADEVEHVGDGSLDHNAAFKVDHAFHS